MRTLTKEEPLVVTFGQSPTLTPVDEINKLHRELSSMARTTLAKAIRIGELLSSVKESIKYGQWGAWLQENVKFNERSARRYVTAFEHKDELLKDASSDTVSELGLVEALKLVSGRGEETEDTAALDDPPSPAKRTFVPRPPSDLPANAHEVLPADEVNPLGGEAIEVLPEPQAALEADEITPPDNRFTKTAKVKTSGDGNLWDKINSNSTLFEKLNGELESIAERAKQLDDHRQKDLCSSARSKFNYRDWQKA
jgi:hypothetical protein